MKKKVVALFLAFGLIAASLIGCGGTSARTPAAEAPAAPAAETPAPAPEASAPEPTQEAQEPAEAPAQAQAPAGSGEILSTGPNGETAVPATSLSLTDDEIAKVKEGGYKVAISFHYGGNDWSSAQRKGLEDTFAKLGIEIVGVTDADFKPEQQAADLETLMAKKPDILVSIPTDAAATADAFQRVADAGTKIVFMDNVPKGFTAGKNYVSCVSADNYGNGVIAAELLAESLGGKGKIGVVFFDADFFVTNQRLEAFEKTMKDKYPDIEIVEKMGFTNEGACDVVADAMLMKSPAIEGIFAHWDVPAEGVLSSLRANGREDVKLTTIDLGNNVAKEIALGNIVGLGAQLPYDQGVAEATLAAYALLGKEAPAYVAVPAKRVDKASVLQAYEDVYHVAPPAFLTEAAAQGN